MKHSLDLGINIVPAEEIFYVEGEDAFQTASELSPGVKAVPVSGSKLRRDFLAEGADIPD